MQGTVLTQGERRAPPSPYKTPTTRAIRKPARLDGLRTDRRTDLLRAGRGPARKHVTSPCLPAAPQGPAGRSPLPGHKHLRGV